MPAVPVLIAHRMPAMRRLLRFNLQDEHVPTAEAGTARECLDWLTHRPAAAVVLDPEVLDDGPAGGALSDFLRQGKLPLLVLSAAPQHRAVARALGGAPFCNRPDDLDRVTGAVRALLQGVGLPALV
jgi:DNA-binding NtrC family response regulator